MINIYTYELLCLKEESINNIFYKYYIFNNKTLLEKYSNLSLNNDNFKASLLIAVYICQKQNLLSNPEDIINELNLQFNKANVVFSIIEERQLNNIQLEYPESGIVLAETDGKTIYVYVNNNFIDKLVNAYLNKDIKIIDNISKDLLSMYNHEYTHIHQINQEKVKQNPIYPNNEESLINYLSNPREIDAHAREVASNLIQSGNSLSNIIYLLKTKSKSLSDKYKAYEKYKKYIDTPLPDKSVLNRMNDNMKQYIIKLHNKKQMVFKRFNRRIIDFLYQDMNFIGDKNFDKSIIF